MRENREKKEKQKNTQKYMQMQTYAACMKL